MTEGKYKYLEDHGRRIFNTVYDWEKKEEETKTQELVRELLTIFHTGVLSIVKENGEIPDIETLVTGVRTPLFQGVFSEATLLSENQKQFTKSPQGDFPIRLAVNATREKIESILTAFATKGWDAATAYIKRLLKESTSETSMFKAQAEEALRKYNSSEQTRKKTNKRLSEAIGKFQENRHILLEKQELLESEKISLNQERDRLHQDIERIAQETTRTIQRNKELEGTLKGKEVELLVATERLQNVEKELERGKKARESLASIDERLKAIAKNGSTWPERLLSILAELEQLRKQEERFKNQSTLYSQIVQRNEELKALNEGLIERLQTQEQRAKEDRLASILDENYNVECHVIEWYERALDEYFTISLREFPKIIKNDTELRGSSARLCGLYSVMQLRGLNPIEVGKKRLEELKESIKKRKDLHQHDLAGFTVEWVYKEVILFLEHFWQNRAAISAYMKMAGDKTYDVETVI